MTTDPFTEAARAEAERWYPDLWEDSRHEYGAEGFAVGAEWARAQLAEQEDGGHDGRCGCGCQDAQEPTDTGDLVAVSWTDCDCEWETKYCDENHRRKARIPRSALTRAALSAARAARRDEEDDQ